MSEFIAANIQAGEYTRGQILKLDTEPVAHPPNEICPDCGKHFDIGDWPYPCAGMGHTVGPFFTGSAALHTSEKTYIDVHPNHPDARPHIPGRTDRPMNAKMKAAGFVRKEISVHEVRKLERQHNMVSEKLNYNSNGSAEKAMGSD